MAMVNANYLLGLIAVFAVTTTLFGMIALFWATRRRTNTSVSPSILGLLSLGRR